MNRGWFKTGKDERRHELTPEEKQRGYTSALHNIQKKYGIMETQAKRYLTRRIDNTQNVRADPFFIPVKAVPKLKRAAEIRREKSGL